MIGTGRAVPTALRSNQTVGRLLHGLRLRLAVLLAAVFLVFYLVTAGLIYGLTAQLTQDDVDAVLGDTTRPLAARVLKDLDRGIFPQEFVTLAKLSEMYPKVSAIVLRDAQGNVIASTAPRVTRTLPYLSAGGTQRYSTERVDSSWYRVLTLPLRDPYRHIVGYLQMTLNLDHDRSSLARLAYALLLVGGLGILLAALAGFFLSRLWLDPAVRAWRQQEHFVADASHELRTPLTVMRLNLDLALSRPEATVAEAHPWLQAVEEEIRRLHRLSEQLLALARGDAAGSARRQLVDLRSVVNDAAAAHRMAAEAKGLTLAVEIGSIASTMASFAMYGDPDALYQLVAILLDNAVKYTPAGAIRMVLTRQANALRLEVSDTGIGIGPQHLERVFDRFYRTDEARAKASGGTGLGLAIARDIVLAHGGQIGVTSVIGQGTTFSIVLPVN